MPNHASRRSAELAVACHVTGDAADEGALDASLGFGR
jgi:predicted amidohydrolase YtcJ